MRELLETKTQWMEFVKTLLFENKLLRSVYQLFFKRILCFRTKKKRKKEKHVLQPKNKKLNFILKNRKYNCGPRISAHAFPTRW